MLLCISREKSGTYLSLLDVTGGCGMGGGYIEGNILRSSRTTHTIYNHTSRFKKCANNVTKYILCLIHLKITM